MADFYIKDTDIYCSVKRMATKGNGKERSNKDKMYVWACAMKLLHQSVLGIDYVFLFQEKVIEICRT